MTELDDIYAPELLEISGNITKLERLDKPDATVSTQSKLCGSKITVDLNIKDNLISDFGQDIEACLLGQSAAAIVAKYIVGTSITEFHQVSEQMRKMLKEDGAPPNGKWSELALLENVKHFRARHTSTLLVFDAVEKAIEQINSSS